jgi:hypothetical protein
MSAIVIVRMVRSSSSSIPANLQQRAMAAWRSANIWMTQDVLIFFIGFIYLQFGTEDRKFAPNLQFLLFVRPEKRTVRLKLLTVRQRDYARVIYYDYFSKLL